MCVDCLNYTCSHKTSVHENPYRNINNVTGSTAEAGAPLRNLTFCSGILNNINIFFSYTNREHFPSDTTKVISTTIYFLQLGILKRWRENNMTKVTQGPVADIEHHLICYSRTATSIPLYYRPEKWLSAVQSCYDWTHMGQFIASLKIPITSKNLHELSLPHRDTLLPRGQGQDVPSQIQLQEQVLSNQI